MEIPFIHRKSAGCIRARHMKGGGVRGGMRVEWGNTHICCLHPVARTHPWCMCVCPCCVAPFVCRVQVDPLDPHFSSLMGAWVTALTQYFPSSSNLVRPTIPAVGRDVSC